MDIHNFTNHAVYFFHEGDCDFSDPRRVVVRDGATPYYSVPAGTPLNVQRGNKPLNPDFSAPVPLKGAVDFVGYDSLPKERRKAPAFRHGDIRRKLFYLLKGVIK